MPGIVVFFARPADIDGRRPKSRAGRGMSRRLCVRLPELAAQAAELSALHLKDEANRFGLGQLEGARAGAYAVADLLLAELARRGIRPTAATTAEPNCAPLSDWRHHGCLRDGRPSWAQRRSGCPRFGARCCIFVRATVSRGPGRGDPAQYGAEIRRVPGTYDDAVRSAAAEAARPGLVHRLRHVLAGLYRDAAADDAGLSADGRRGA